MIKFSVFFSVFLWTGTNDFKTQRMNAGLLENRGKNIPFSNKTDKSLTTIMTMMILMMTMMVILLPCRSLLLLSLTVCKWSPLVNHLPLTSSLFSKLSVVDVRDDLQPDILSHDSPTHLNKPIIITKAVQIVSSLQSGKIAERCQQQTFLQMRSR